MEKIQQPALAASVAIRSKRRKYLNDSDRPAHIKTRVPIEISDFLTARSHERNGEFFTLRSLADALVASFLEVRPWETCKSFQFAKSRTSESFDPDRPRQSGFVQLNLFIPRGMRCALEELAGDKHVTLSSALLTAILWWICTQADVRGIDAEIVEIIDRYGLPQYGNDPEAEWR